VDSFRSTVGVVLVFIEISLGLCGREHFDQPLWDRLPARIIPQRYQWGPVISLSFAIDYLIDVRECYHPHP